MSPWSGLRRRVRMPAPDEARLLLIPVELPIWEIVRIGYSAKDENAVDVTQVIIPGDRMEKSLGCVVTNPPSGPIAPLAPDGPPVAPAE